MLEFSNRTYQSLLRLAKEQNIVSNCREYPSLALSGEAVSFDAIRTYLQKQFVNAQIPCGVYVHIPFCSSRCTFCKYYAEAHQSSDAREAYSNLLENELRLYQIHFKTYLFENLFIGGGTPTLLNEKEFERLMSVLMQYCNFKQTAQKTIEGSPETVTLSKLQLYREYGIDRISFGLQSSSADVLKKVGRRHRVNDVFRAFDDARKAGFSYVATELLWGLPGETVDSYEQTISDIIRLEPDFVEGYILTKGKRVNIDPACPPETSLGEVIEKAKQKLCAEGYELAFEGNCIGFIKKGRHKKNALNQNTDSLYRHYTSVIGFGPGASSHFSDKKYLIVPDYELYKKCLLDNRFPYIEALDIPAEEYKRYYIISQIGFFREIKKEAYKRLFGTSLLEDFPLQLVTLIEKGTVIDFGTHYKWRIGTHALDHQAFYLHVVRYWYSEQYIRALARRHKHVEIEEACCGKDL